MRFFINISYDGTNYAGWQRQPNAKTVQGTFERALTTLLRNDISTIGCGRTDKGVHAKNYIAHADLNINAHDIKNVLYKLNRILPKDITCHQIFKVEGNAHARYDATARTYVYDMHMQLNPFKGMYSTYIPYGHLLNFSILDQVADIISNKNDFSSFCKADGSDTGTNCEIFTSKWSFNLDEDSMSYKITANRFLRGMVRLIVGSSLSIGTGKLCIDAFRQHVNNGTRSPLMYSAPPQGLALTNISYDIIASE